MTEITVHAGSTDLVRIVVTVQDGGVVSDAAISGTVRDPNTRVIAQDVAFANAGSGVYTLTMDPTWTAPNGAVRLGTYFLDVLVVQDENTLAERIAVHVAP